ncbi:hypothetical protein AC71_4845 [Escherichia coli 2-222-05_S4_C1]|nr:hypothetical protein AC71_4845 [Escherichia coli 2-222-05_S4_C1]
MDRNNSHITFERDVPLDSAYLSIESIVKLSSVLNVILFIITVMHFVDYA